MNKASKYFLAGFIALLVIVQFFGPQRPENKEVNPGDLLAVEVVSDEVHVILRNACYDCHSMETKYPWYANIAPIKWSIYDHVRVGRDELNFSEWDTLSKRKKLRKLKDIAEEVEEGKMPLDGYVKLHPDAKLSDSQRHVIISWSKDYSKRMLGD